MHQLRWIKDTMEQEKLLVIPSHDDTLLQDLAAKAAHRRGDWRCAKAG